MLLCIVMSLYIQSKFKVEHFLNDNKYSIVFLVQIKPDTTQVHQENLLGGLNTRKLTTHAHTQCMHAPHTRTTRKHKTSSTSMHQLNIKILLKLNFHLSHCTGFDAWVFSFNGYTILTLYSCYFIIFSVVVLVVLVLWGRLFLYCLFPRILQ